MVLMKGRQSPRAWALLACLPACLLVLSFFKLLFYLLSMLTEFRDEHLLVYIFGRPVGEIHT